MNEGTPIGSWSRGSRRSPGLHLVEEKLAQLPFIELEIAFSGKFLRPEIDKVLQHLITMGGAVHSQRLQQIGVLLDRARDFLKSSVKSVDLYGFLDDLISADDQAISREELIVQTSVPLLLNRGEIDLVDLGRLAAAPGRTSRMSLGSAVGSRPLAYCNASSTVSCPVQGSLPGTKTSPST